MFSSSVPALPARRRPCISPGAARRVLLADRARFPRDKPCGGGLTGRALKQAPCDVTPVVERVVDTFELRLHYKRSFRRTSSEPLILMTQRRRLDAYLAEQAAAAGATFRDGARVDALAIGAEGITARVGETDVAADTLVGADGANGIVAKAVGLEDGIVRGVALEGNVGWEHLDRERFASTAVVELGPAGRRLRLAVPQGRPRESRRRRLGPGGAAPARPPGTALAHLRDRPRACSPTFAATGCRCVASARRPRPATTSLLVGDAAGLVDPLSGDGMYEAFTSARLAADAILAGDLDGLPDGSRAAARPPRRRLVVGQARARPPPRSVLLGRSLAGRVRRRQRAAARRCRASERGSRPRSPAAAPRCARGAPRLTTTVSVNGVTLPRNGVKKRPLLPMFSRT